MQILTSKTFLRRTTVALVSCVFAIGTAQAEKPSWAGEKHGKKHEKPERDYYEDSRGSGRERDYRFGDDSRHVIFDYYGTQQRAGKCPPGLAKKGNGCMPPGQAKKWAKGHPLPPDLRYYELPPELMMRLPPPPPRHRYVQVAGDILMIAVGTSMVIDAIEDIAR